MYGGATGQDGVVLDVCESPAKFHFPVSRGLEEAINARPIWFDFGSISIQNNCLKKVKGPNTRMLHEVCLTLTKFRAMYENALH